MLLRSTLEWGRRVAPRQWTDRWAPLPGGALCFQEASAASLHAPGGGSPAAARLTSSAATVGAWKRIRAPARRHGRRPAAASARNHEAGTRKRPAAAGKV